MAAGEFIRRAWEKYSDEKLMISATSDEGDRQHTVTPIAQFKDGKYSCTWFFVTMGLQQSINRIFHPHADVKTNRK